MLKSFLKRIISEVIKELISPEFKKVYAEFGKVYDEFGRVYARMDKMEASRKGDMAELKEELRHLDRRLDDLYKVVVRREEHYSVVEDVKKLREDMEMVKRKVGI